MLKRLPVSVQRFFGVHYEGREKRIYPRREIRQVIKYRYEFVHIHGPDRELSGNLHDISEGGICFTSPAPIGRDLVLRVQIQMGEFGLRIPATARTIWTRSCRDGNQSFYHVGAAFIDLDEESQALIRNFVSIGPSN